MPYKTIINTALGKILGRKRLRVSLVAIEFNTRGQPPMRASIFFASITVVLLNKNKILNKRKVQFEYVKSKHTLQFEAEVKKKHNFHT